VTDEENGRQSPHGATTARLRTAGLRVTPQRRAVLSAFIDGASDHLTAEAVGERARREVPELARATVYKVLAELTRVGLIQIVPGPGVTRYDANPDQDHQHFQCRCCGVLHDVKVVGLGELQLWEGTGFVTERRTVIFEGLCPQCAQQ